jgi:hypothetical protein
MTPLIITLLIGSKVTEILSRQQVLQEMEGENSIRLAAFQKLSPQHRSDCYYFTLKYERRY